MLAHRTFGAGRSPVLLRLGAVVLGVSLALGGAVAHAATADPTAGPGAGAGVTSTESPTRVSVAGTITVPPAEAGLIPAETLAEYTSPTGELTRQLDALEGGPASIGVDPMIVASIRILGTNAPQTAIDWLARLASVPNETFALAYADADISSLAQAGHTVIPGPTSFVIEPSLYPQPEAGDETDTPPASADPDDPSAPEAPPEVPTLETITQLPYSLDAIVWPRENTVIASDLAVFSAEAPVTTIVSSSNLSNFSAEWARASAGDAQLLVSDAKLSELLRAAASATNDAAWQESFDALLAALATRDAGDTTLLTLSRDIPIGVNRIAETLEALQLSAAITSIPLSELLDEDAVPATIADTPVSDERLTGLRSLFATESRIASFATVLSDPSLLTGERRLAILALSSNSWGSLTAGWAPAVADYLDDVSSILSSVKVESSSTLNLRSYTGDLPITVSNSLRYPVTVYVSVAADTAILDVIDKRVELVIEPGSQSRALVPVRSIANGDVTLRVSLASAEGVPVSAPAFIIANVQAEWESTFTLVVVILLLLVFIGGIIRTIVRRRRMRREADAAGSDELAGKTAQVSAGPGEATE